MSSNQRLVSLTLATTRLNECFGFFREGPWPSMDRAAAFGAVSRGFKSLRARKV